MKDSLKLSLRKEQKKKCAVSGKKLKKQPSRFDADRITLKKDGGLLKKRNVRAVDPVAHMKLHDNYRKRSPELTELKILIDAREQVRKFLNSCSNRILAAIKRKTDQMDPQTKKWLQGEIKEAKSELSKIDRRIMKHLKSINMPIIDAALNIRGLGPVTVAYLVVYVDITKARYASSLWSYVGLDKPSHKRYTKGEAGGGNKTLRTVLYTMACSMIKTRAVYRDVYDAEKQKLSNSERLVESRNVKGKLVTVAWKDTMLKHRHDAAIRKMIKHLLADFWYVWRTFEGLTTEALYVQEKMGHQGIIRPEERGWIYRKAS